MLRSLVRFQLAPPENVQVRSHIWRCGTDGLKPPIVCSYRCPKQLSVKFRLMLDSVAPVPA